MSQNDNKPQSIVAEDSKGEGLALTSPYSPRERLCKGPCGQPIPAKRLAAQPNAQLCVPCLLAVGDVPPIRRFDEPCADGEVHSTFFTKDRRIERQINHFNKSAVASQAEFDIIAGDDAHLGPEANEIVDGARSLASVFIDEEEEAPITVAKAA